MYDDLEKLRYDDVEKLRSAIIERYVDLSKRLQQVAKYVIDNQNDFAIETVAVIAEESGVPPSAVVRFAKEFGFDGASSMQRLFREQLITNRASASYKDRLRRSKKRMSNEVDIGKTFSRFVEESSGALLELDNRATFNSIRQMAQEIKRADCLFVGGVRRSYPVAAYFSYAFSKAGKRNILLDGIGGFGGDQVGTITSNDFLLLTSFKPYGTESKKAAEAAVANGARVGLITDSEVSPLVSDSSFQVYVQDPELLGFRSLSSTLAIAQAIVVEYLSLDDAE